MNSLRFVSICKEKKVISVRMYEYIRNGKKYINFEIFDRSQHKLHLTNTY